MVSANLVNMAQAGTLIYIIADHLDALGVAYSTTNPLHLLNVPSGKMGAFADAPDGFFHWLQTADAALHKQRIGLHTKHYTADDFVPRALYGGYLQSIWRDTQQRAAQKKIVLKWVPSIATYIRKESEFTLLTVRGDAIAVDAIVLATGNETKPVFTHLPPSCVIQNPWELNAFIDAKNWPSPVLLMGVGLTAIDTVLALRSAGYMGNIVAFSRHGALPHRHAAAAPFAFDPTLFESQPSLVAMQRLLRRTIAHHGSWRPVIDALRPHTQTLWQRLSALDRQRFLSRLLTFWNIHRHRMAPEIADRIDDEIMRGGFRIVASRNAHTRMEDERLTVTLNGEILYPSRIINCTGPQLNIAKSSGILLHQAVADGFLEPQETALGIATDPQLRAWGRGYPNIYAMGALLTGQLLESTAVPELRSQAARIAQTLAFTSGSGNTAP